MAFDRSTGKVILFGGFNRDYLYDTWSYDSATNAWTNLSPAKHPTGRSIPAMAYDVKTKSMVLFGGLSGYNGCNDTWIYNSTSNSWQNKTTKNSPPARCGHTMIYDDISGNILMFGGSSSVINPTYFNDTWTYNATLNKWTLINCLQATTARYNQGMVYDNAHDTMILFGGQGYSGPSFGDTWAFDFKHHLDSGHFTSTGSDTGGNAHYGTLEWDANIPANTSLRLQLRSADTKNDLDFFPFIGPDGTCGTYYSTSGQQISAVHNDSRWFQYRIFLSTDDMLCNIQNVSPL
jgi:N-acetylneuraminic acid mutarotase